MQGLAESAPNAPPRGRAAPLQAAGNGGEKRAEKGRALGGQKEGEGGTLPAQRAVCAGCTPLLRPAGGKKTCGSTNRWPSRALTLVGHTHAKAQEDAAARAGFGLERHSMSKVVQMHSGWGESSMDTRCAASAAALVRRKTQSGSCSQPAAVSSCIALRSTQQAAAAPAHPMTSIHRCWAPDNGKPGRQGFSLTARKQCCGQLAFGLHAYVCASAWRRLSLASGGRSCTHRHSVPRPPGTRRHR